MITGTGVNLSCLLFVYYALRREEVLGWKWSQIDFERKTISLETSIIDVSAKLDKNDILKGITIKGFNMDYYSCKERLYFYLRELAAQIKTELLK